MLFETSYMLRAESLIIRECLNMMSYALRLYNTYVACLKLVNYLLFCHSESEHLWLIPPFITYTIKLKSQSFLLPYQTHQSSLLAEPIRNTRHWQTDVENKGSRSVNLNRLSLHHHIPTSLLLHTHTHTHTHNALLAVRWLKNLTYSCETREKMSNKIVWEASS